MTGDFLPMPTPLKALFIYNITNLQLLSGYLELFIGDMGTIDLKLQTSMVITLIGRVLLLIK